MVVFFANEFVLKGGSVTSINVLVGVPVFFFLSLLLALSLFPVDLLGHLP